MMKVKKFVKQVSKEDSPIGDLANDILNDKDFPWKDSEERIWSYLEFKTMQGNTHDTFKEFKKEFLKYN